MRKVRNTSFGIRASIAKESGGNKKLFLSGSELTRIFNEIVEKDL